MARAKCHQNAIALVPAAAYSIDEDAIPHSGWWLVKVKRRVHDILEVGQSGDRASQAADTGLMLLIVANVAAIIVSTDTDIHDAASGFFRYFEMISFCIFGVEYLLRIWSCTSNPDYAHPVTGRLRYLLRPLMLADATAVFTYFTFLFLPTGLDLGALRTLRLLSRLASLARYSAGMQAVVAVATARRSELLAVVSVVGALLVLASSLMYFIEHSVQPEKFSSIPETMWWSVITVTTVGYGDVWPITPLGRLLAGIIALLGVGIFALPAGILGSGFVEQFHRRNTHSSEMVCPHCGGGIAPNSPFA